ncbi:DUF2510 domain-containing protein [Rhodococcus triatomae]
MTQHTPPEGWYPDPNGAPTQRWWDGSRWTDATMPHEKHQYQQDPHQASPGTTRNGFGITSLVLAIVGVVFGLVPLTGFIALILGALAVLFGLLGFSRVRKGLATNKIMTLIGAGLGAVAIALGVWGMTIFFGAVDDLDQAFDDLGGSDATSSRSYGSTDSATAASEPQPGSREDPYSQGDLISIPQWDVTIHSTSLDAADAVLAENQFNDPPAPGRQFVMADVTATYTGTDTGLAWVELDFHVLGSQNNVFGTAQDDYCGVVPNALQDSGEQYPGGTVRGNVCVSVASDQLTGADWLVKYGYGQDQIFVSLQ